MKTFLALLLTITSVLGAGDQLPIYRSTLTTNRSPAILTNAPGVLVNPGNGLLRWTPVTTTNLYNADQFAIDLVGVVSIKDSALVTNLIVKGDLVITNNTDLSRLFLQTSNHTTSFAVDTASGQTELIGDDGLVFDSGIGSQLIKTVASEWQFYGDTFSPGSSNAAHLATALQPFADLYITDNRITATNGTLYLNGIPVGGGGGDSLWSSSGANAILTNSGDHIFFRRDFSGLNLESTNILNGTMYVYTPKAGSNHPPVLVMLDNQQGNAFYSVQIDPGVFENGLPDSPFKFISTVSLGANDEMVLGQNRMTNIWFTSSGGARFSGMVSNANGGYAFPDATVQTTAASPITDTGTLFVDVAGNDATGERNNPGRPFLTLTGAVAFAQSGDTIRLGNGDFTNNVVLPSHVSLFGQGMYNTTIWSSNDFTMDGVPVCLGTNSIVAHLHIKNTLTNGIGHTIGRSAIAGQPAFENAVIWDVWSEAETGGYFNDGTSFIDLPCSVTIRDCIFTSHQQCFTWVGTIDDRIEARNSLFVSTGPSPLPGHDGVNAAVASYDGYAEMWFCSVFCTNFPTANIGVHQLTPNGTIALWSTWIKTDGEGVPDYQIVNTNGGTVKVYGLLRSNAVDGVVLQIPSLMTVDLDMIGTNSLVMTNGASPGYVATSDAFGRMSWGEPPGGGWRFDSGQGYLLSDFVTTNDQLTVFLGGSTLVFTNGSTSFNIFDGSDGFADIQGGGGLRLEAPAFQITNSTPIIVDIFGKITLDGYTNQVGMSGSGQLTVDGVPVGGSQVWTNNNLTNYVNLPDGPKILQLQYANDVSGPEVRPRVSQTVAEIDLSTSANGQNSDAGSANINIYTRVSGGNHIPVFASYGAAGDLVLLDPFRDWGDGMPFKFQSAVTLADGDEIVEFGNNQTNMVRFNIFTGGASMSLADTNGLGGFITMTVSTNSGSAVATFTGSPPSATVPVGNDGKYDFASGITVGGTNAFNGDVTVGLVTLSFRNGLLFAHSP